MQKRFELHFNKSETAHRVYEALRDALYTYVPDAPDPSYASNLVLQEDTGRCVAGKISEVAVCTSTFTSTVTLVLTDVDVMESTASTSSGSTGRRTSSP